MSALEDEIITKFQQLDSASKQRVLNSLTSELQAAYDYDSWWAEVEALQAKIHTRLGHRATIGTLSLLDELREEAS